MKILRYYTLAVVFCFLANVILSVPGANAQTHDELLDSGLSQEVLQGLFNSNEPISNQSDAANLSQSEIAPPPLVITTSGGDIYLLQGDGVKAKMKIDQQGTLETTYSLDGADYKMINEFGEEFHYEYSPDGQTVQILNANNEVVGEHSFELGKATAFSAQGKITYQYSDDGLNRLVTSTDEWGNVTHYDDLSRPTTITDTDGNVVGEYKFDSKGRMQSFTDRTGNVTVFNSDGIRPLYTKNAQGTKTQEYRYDSDGHLDAVMNITNGQITEVENGYYTVTYDTVEVLNDDGTVMTDENGEAVLEYVAVGVYSYDTAGNVESVSDLGMGGVITGFTEYDDYGRVCASYNAEGTKVQEYKYNEHGFLEMTISLGAVDPLAGEQTVLTYTIFDGNGRPSEVWQLGDGENDKIKIQEYVYKENGLLDITVSYGIERDDQGNAVLNDAGNYIYFETSKTVYDKKGRPEAVYGMVRNEASELVVDSDGKPVLEIQQKYVYNKEGFLSKTISYGFNGAKTGETVFDAYSRPVESYNSTGALTQTYTYREDGFLAQTSNYGDAGTLTGYTLYDAKGKPTDVFNHEGSLVQKYIYDENGSMIMSLSLSSEEGVNDLIAATIQDKTAIADLWNSDWDSTYDFLDPDNKLTSEYLTSVAWTALADGDIEKAKAFTLKCIQTFSGEALSQQKSLDELPTGPGISQNWAVNDVGTCYNILGLALEEEGAVDAAVSAYKIQASDFGYAQAYDPAEGSYWLVSDGSKKQLGELNVETSVVTGYTMFGGDSKPVASYQFYEKFDENGVSLGVQATKVQEYVYSYEGKTKNKETGEYSMVTKYSGFVQKTSNYGDFDADTGEQVVTGYTVFDKLGRQQKTYNDEDQAVQSYQYSNEGFLKSTVSYGQNGVRTGTTIFDSYSRPVASFNMMGTSTGKMPKSFIQALSNGLTNEELSSQEWQPYLKGLSQTFEYGSDGFLSSSKSYGEAIEIKVTDFDGFASSMGSRKGDAEYKAKYDFNEDGSINTADMTIFNDAFSGIMEFSETYGSTSDGPGLYLAKYDYDSDGDVDKTDLRVFAKTFENTAKYSPTWTGVTHYDKYGKADKVINVITDEDGNPTEGIMVQQYEYNTRGFMEKSVSYGVVTDDNGTIIMDGDTPIALATGYTLFDAKSRPVSTYSIYSSATTQPQESKVQDYVYEEGFLVKTVNYGDIDAETGNAVETGYTEFDRYGRQTVSYNESDQKVSTFKYSSQGFLNETYNYGKNGAFQGKTTFNKSGRPVEAYNMYASRNGKETGLTQKFNYNEYGLMSHSETFGENQTLTGTTYYNGYGKGLRVENEKGFVISSYHYNERGFMEKTQSLAFVEVTDPEEIAQLQDSGLYVEITTTDDSTNETVTAGGFYAVTGHTEFDAYSRPTDSYQCYWDTQGEGERVKVQEYKYEDGFLVETITLGRPDETGAQQQTGRTEFDKYGRQVASYNEFDELTTKYKYSTQGFLSGTSNHGARGVITGKTEIGALGKPTGAYNQKGTLVQSFNYDSVTGQLTGSTSYGEPDAETGNPTLTGTTTYDAYGKATAAYNDKGAQVQKYVYDNQGFMLETVSLGDDIGQGPVETGRTVYDHASRPMESYTISASGVETKVQVFVYNSAVNLSNYEQYIANPTDAQFAETETGFLTTTFSHGKNNHLAGYTKFNNYGQQEASYNEFDEMTVAFKYSKSGFMTESWNYTINKTRTGVTSYSATGRPDASYNEKGAVIQEFNYNDNGFLVSTNGYGDLDENGDPTLTQTTHYDEFGKQTHSMNIDGAISQTFHYDDAGFLERSTGWAQREDTPDTLIWYEVLDQGYAVETSYTLYNDASRPSESYSVYEGASGKTEMKTQEFIYNTGVDETNYQAYMENPEAFSETVTGFMTQSVTFALNNSSVDAEGNLVFTDSYSHVDEESGITTANELGSEVIVSGLTSYNRYGRPDTTYNHEGQKVSVSKYNQNGFLQQTENYGDNGAITGKLLYNAAGRPTEALNHKNVKVTEYFYNDQGGLDVTLNYNNGTITQRTEYDIYSKATASYQLFSGKEGNKFGEQQGYQYDASGTANYDVNNPTARGSGTLTQQSYYNEFGLMKASVTYGRSGKETSYVVFDKYQRPVEVYNISPDNQNGRDTILSSIIVQSENVYTGEAAANLGSARVQSYNYNANGFMTSTISYQRSKDYDDQGNPVADGTWEKETSITYYASNGQQINTFLLKDGVQANLAKPDHTVGAKQAEYKYNTNGFLDRAYNYQDNSQTGYTKYDDSGRQTTSYNDKGTAVNAYWYNSNGFLIGSTSLGQ
ncbi:MAG: hypothetical protein GY853_07305 [PVC group bacterium]|nr:hypothetical protein [PVC group bacterium]